MASIETRKLKGGKITRYRVKWRTGGTRDGAWDVCRSKTWPHGLTCGLSGVVATLLVMLTS
ncbi:hypothetical protein DMB66_24490 [Actinoplanes sp. ATCC 53533]|uniref:hypothetical protein n=1 Tax=Actinoplanes sp. ATCC 53533 TaxID=1288362 RepID=UPI000F7BB06B|nr:hypothetical protein [Actinoplanes sp. ATCC 53533]RSM61586.1 hypothetical protein DMB66_24490 [Actinoplanes sp. ATCC 53533]